MRSALYSLLAVILVYHRAWVALHGDYNHSPLSLAGIEPFLSAEGLWFAWRLPLVRSGPMDHAFRFSMKRWVAH